MRPRGRTRGPASSTAAGQGADVPFTAGRDGAWESDEHTPVFVISVAAELSGLHAQTLRQYDRLGLVSPGRTPGGGRRYSRRDIAMLREVVRLSSLGIGLEGVRRILDLQHRVPLGGRGQRAAHRAHHAHLLARHALRQPARRCAWWAR